MTVPQISVVIPCFRQIHFLEEAIESVLAQTFQDFEIIVVDDGSPEPDADAYFARFAFPKTTLIRQENQGVSAARNAGIARARGKYILPLDADDKIAPTYMEQAWRILEADNNIGIVYCKAEFFGLRTGPWELPEFSLPGFLFRGNCIFNACLYRKVDWEIVGGYDHALLIAEDYDLSMGIVALGRRVHRIDEILFFYRQQPDSVIQTNLSREKEGLDLARTLAHLIRKHNNLYAEHAHILAQCVVVASAVRPAKLSRFSRLKNRVRLACYGALAKLPAVSGWAEKKRDRAADKLGLLPPRSNFQRYQSELLALFCDQSER